MARFLHTVGLGCTLALVAAPGLGQQNRPKTAGEVAAGSFAWGHSLAYVRNHFVKAAEEFWVERFAGAMLVSVAFVFR